MDLSESTKEAQERHSETLLKLEAGRRARVTAAPTDPDAVKTALRERGQPVTLFGEGPADRRERLKLMIAEAEVAEQVEREGLEAVVARIQGGSAGGVQFLGSTAGGRPATGAVAAATTMQGAASAAEQQSKTFYTRGSEALTAARKVIAEYSWKAAEARLAVEAASAGEGPSALAAAAAEDARAAALYKTMKRMRATLSQVADDRPVSCCAASRDGSVIVTGGWSGVAKLWSPTTVNHLASCKGHKDRIVGVAFHPDTGVQNGGGLLVTAAADSTAKLWKLPPAAVGAAESPPSSSAGTDAEGDAAMSSGSVYTGPSSGAHAGHGASATRSLTEHGLREQLTLSGHTLRLASVAWHPSGAVVGTTSYDRTWRLWDVETGTELMLQEGHAREVYPIAFHPDGSLVATGDLGGVGRVWDLRSGKAVFTLKGHAKQLIALDWSPNGHYVASGSDDNSSIIWELRQQRTLYTLPGHDSLISRVRFAPVTGEYLVTASFDGTAKVWSTRDWTPLGVLRGHDSKVRPRVCLSVVRAVCSVCVQCAVCCRSASLTHCCIHARCCMHTYMHCLTPVFPPPLIARPCS